MSTIISGLASILRGARSLFRSTAGSGELIGMFCCVALALGAGVTAATILGGGAKAGAGRLGTQITGLSVQ